MKQRTRRVLFWFAVALFAVATWAAIRYAQGYAYDFDTGTFVRTGALAATINTGATLYIDEREIGQSSFIGNRVGKEGLLPGTYIMRLAREGYSTWRKSVVVEEGQLTDFPHVLLLPTDDESLLLLKAEASQSLREAHTLKDSVGVTGKRTIRIGDFELRERQLFDNRTASASFIADGVLGFSIAEHDDRIVWWTRNELWVLWLRNTDQQPYRSEGERQAITRFAVPIVRAAWFRDSEHIVVDLGNQSYRVLETDSRGGTNITKI